MPGELAVPLVLGGGASLACQWAIDVARPNCEPSPTLLYTFVVSGSGTRKSAVLAKVLSPIVELEQELIEDAAERMPEYEAAMMAWDVEKNYLRTDIERRAQKNETLGQVQERLTCHISVRPLKPLAPKFIYEDPTSEAVADGLL